VVRPPVTEGGSEDAERDADDQRGNDGEQREFDGGRHVLIQVGEHRPVGLFRDPQVAVEQAIEVVRVLDRKRLIEPVLMAERRDGGGVIESPLPQVGGDGVTGDQVGHHERHQSDAD
jgi:hypothetical protein